MTKDYNDPKKLAEARWHGGEKHSYEEMADYLDCSTGTISLRMNNKEHYGVEDVDKYGPEDFQDEGGPFEMEVDPQEILFHVSDYLEDWVEEPKVEQRHVFADELDLAIVVASKDQITEAVESAYHINEPNSYIAVSEHIVNAVSEHLESEAVGLLSVGASIDVIQESRISRNSSARFVFEDERPGMDYNNLTWLRYQIEVEGASREELMEKCSVLPSTIDRFMRKV